MNSSPSKGSYFKKSVHQKSNGVFLSKVRTCSNSERNVVIINFRGSQELQLMCHKDRGHGKTKLKIKWCWWSAERWSVNVCGREMETSVGLYWISGQLCLCIIDGINQNIHCREIHLPSRTHVNIIAFICLIVAPSAHCSGASELLEN